MYQKVKLQKSKIKGKALYLDTTDTEAKNESEYNKYFMPDFFAYLNKSLLPHMPYWSNILLEKPSAIHANTEKKHNLLVINNAKDRQC